MIARRTLPLLALAWPARARAAWQFDERDGELRVLVRVFRLLPVVGRFQRFRLRLAPEIGLLMQADAASLELDPPTMEERVRGPEWFDAANHPRITVAAPLPPPGESEAAVMLTLRGVSRPVQARLVWAPQAGALDATASISRSAFGLVADQVMVGDAVTIALSVVRRNTQ